MHIYFMGIGGTAMGSVAILLKQEGHRISGTDLNVYAPMSERLQQADIAFSEGFDAGRLQTLNPDLVVVGNVIGRGNPEAEWLLETRALPFVSLPQLIGEHLIGRRPSIVITGTHGKTTTTALTTHLLLENQCHPGYLIAGVPGSNQPSSAMGQPGSPFVIEGDEYDCAFFDKRSKFIHYFPHTLILNNLEFDHGDIFRDLEDIKRSFQHLLRLVPRNGNILINGDDPKLVDWVVKEAHSKVWKIGFESHNDLRISDFEERACGSRFCLQLRNRPWMQVSWSLAARYNARNAAMAGLASALHLHPDDPATLQGSAAFASFSGVRRRQQILYSSERFLIVEDFGHHPTAIGETLVSFRNRFPDHRLWAVFEPRSNTTRSPAFQHLWPVTLSHADEAWIGAIHRLHLLDAEHRLNTQQLKTDLEDRGTPTHLFADNAALRVALHRRLPGIGGPLLVLFFTNGSFDGLMQATAQEAERLDCDSGSAEL